LHKGIVATDLGTGVRTKKPFKLDNKVIETNYQKERLP